MQNNLGNALLVEVVGAPVGASPSISNKSSRLDMQGRRGIEFVCPIVTSAATAKAEIKVQSNDVDADEGMVDVPGASAGAKDTGGSELNNLLLTVHVYNSRKRYMQCVRTSDCGNIAYGALIAVRYGSDVEPESQPATVADSADVVG